MLVVRLITCFLWILCQLPWAPFFPLTEPPRSLPVCLQNSTFHRVCPLYSHCKTTCCQISLAVICPHSPQPFGCIWWDLRVLPTTRLQRFVEQLGNHLLSTWKVIQIKSNRREQHLHHADFLLVSQVTQYPPYSSSIPTLLNINLPLYLLSLVKSFSHMGSVTIAVLMTLTFFIVLFQTPLHLLGSQHVWQVISWNSTPAKLKCTSSQVIRVYAGILCSPWIIGHCSSLQPSL